MRSRDMNSKIIPRILYNVQCQCLICPHLALRIPPAAARGVATGSRSSTPGRLISPAEAVISSGAVAG